MTLTVGPLAISQQLRKVSVGGAEVKLTGKEYAMLELLVLRSGSVVTHDAFLSHFYNETNKPKAKFIDVIMCKLRKKLALYGADNLITTV